METNPRRIGIIGMPQDIGSTWRGVDMGPGALRAAGLHAELNALGFAFSDYGNVNCVSMDEAQRVAGDEKLRHKHSVLRNCEQLGLQVAACVGRGEMPLVLGGDHSQTMGTLAGLKEKHQGDIGILYVDAHGDFNTPETSITGNIHGMPLAVVCGYGDPDLLKVAKAPSALEQAVVLFGVRDLDPGEKQNIRSSKVRMITMNEITEKGFGFCLQAALDHLLRHTRRIHLSFDVDSLDPSFARGTGYRISGGFSSREALFLMEKVHDTGALVSMELVEVNPALDDGNQTAKLAVELIARALGKKTV